MNGKVNLEKILKTCEHRGLCEIEETVGEWSFALNDLPINLKIKIVYLAVKGKFKATPNYKIQNPEQATPYEGVSFSDTAEGALNDSLREFLAWWRPEKYKDKTRFILVENW